MFRSSADYIVIFCGRSRQRNPSSNNINPRSARCTLNSLNPQNGTQTSSSPKAVSILPPWIWLLQELKSLLKSISIINYPKEIFEWQSNGLHHLKLRSTRKKQYKAHMETDKGTMVIELFADKTPMTVNNFVFLSREGFYDGVISHRVIDNFMVQGGDPTGTGRGGPGYKFGDEFKPSLKHDKQGILSMANAGPGTNGSQFFITHGPTPSLNGRHTVFGQVVEGLGCTHVHPCTRSGQCQCAGDKDHPCYHRRNLNGRM